MTDRSNEQKKKNGEPEVNAEAMKYLKHILAEEVPPPENSGYVRAYYCKLLGETVCFTEDDIASGRVKKLPKANVFLELTPDGKVMCFIHF